MPSDADVTQRAGSLRALTALTDAEFYALRPQFAQAFVTDRQDRTMDGQPRTSRRDTTDDSCPLPTRAGTLLFIPTSVKQHPLQEVQGQRFGMSVID
jgi:hypothetical protein